MHTMIAMMSVVLVTGSLAGCTGKVQPAAAAGETGRIQVGPLSAGSELRVAEVGMPSTGWVVVHAVRGGQPDLTGSIGHAYVKGGTTRDIVVALSTPLASGD